MDDGLEILADLNGIPFDGQVIIGLSGGADSMALTHYAANQIDRERILCVHVNHMLRGEEAERDEAACEAFCKDESLCIVVFREDVRKYAKTHKIGEEAAGRELRYMRFQSLVKTQEDRILTAHNADDHVETVLLNITRGSGLSGLCGIPAQRENILRPLLRVSRKQIEVYCERHTLPFVNDSTNETDVYARNRIRHRVIPVLAELNPMILSAVGGMTKRIRLDLDFILQEADRLLEESRAPDGIFIAHLCRAHESVLIAALRRYFQQQGCGELSAIHVEHAAAHLKNGMRMTLPGGLEAVCSVGVLRVIKSEEPVSWQILAEFGENLLPDGKLLILSKIPMRIYLQKAKVNNLLFKSVLDCDTITHDLTARCRKAGDRFAPAGRGLSKPMKQLFVEMGIPSDRRNDVVLLEMDGQIVFVEGIGSAECFQVTQSTQTVLCVQCVQGNGCEKAMGNGER